MNIKILRFIIFIISTTIITVITPEIFAQAPVPLMVSPARQEISVNPGEETNFNVRFYNLSDLPVSGIVRVANFTVDNSQGNPRIIKNSNQTWVTIPYGQITIAANDKVSLQAKVKVPADARPGGYYVTVYFETTGLSLKKESVGTNVSVRISPLIYVKVGGSTFEKAVISRFSSPNFFEYGPVKVTTQILNQGDYHIKPRAVLKIFNTFGRLIDQIGLKEENIFPKTIRNYENSLGKKFLMIGRYKLLITILYGEKGQLLESTTYVWVFPWRAALIIIITIILLFFLKIKYCKMKL